ncbi:MAG TPA: nucleotide exchange factor GrpE [Salinimicrobium sp.]|nr:nucleotide exchange factor GrpE [Salinimicrobium sp.]
MDKKKEYQDQKDSRDIKDQVEEILDDAIEEVENENSDTVYENQTGDDQELLKEELQKEKERFLRLFAEFENYKKRTGKERIEMFKTAGQDLMVALLPILDDFDRALIEIKKSGDKDLAKGVELINNKFRETLRAKGLEQMEVKEADVFDAEVHEAITQIPAPSEELKGKIVDVVEKGYKMGDRIIRFPKVVTGK